MIIDERVSERDFGEFEGIPDSETLLPLCLENCEVAKYFYKELDLKSLEESEKQNCFTVKQLLNA